jgi:hypothetical protein
MYLVFAFTGGISTGVFETLELAQEAVRSFIQDNFELKVELIWKMDFNGNQYTLPEKDNPHLGKIMESLYIMRHNINEMYWA